MTANYVTLSALRATGYSLMAITTLITAVRLSQPIIHPKTFQWDDGFLLAAYIFFLVVAILYQVIADTMFKLEAVEAGTIPPYKTISEDGLFIQKVFFVVTSSLWFNLWCVKYSLLAFYKRLIAGLKTYTVIWTAVVVFCFVVLVGAVTSSMLSCSSMKAWFTAGACSTPRDIKAASVSLWYAFAVDVLTDLLVMFLPIGLVWRLQMPLAQKASIGGLFCLGWICIAVAIVRVRELGGTTSSNSAPNPTWLALWGTIETSIAVMIGCCPGLYRRFRPHKKTSYNSYGYGYGYGYGHARSGTGANTQGSRLTATDIELQRGPSDANRITKTTDINISTRVYGDAASSQEELTAESHNYHGTGPGTRDADIQYSFEMK